MTWQGGKLRREIGPLSSFAPLKALAKERDDPGKALAALATALSGMQNEVNLYVRLVSGDDGETVEHWHVRGGAKAAKAVKAEKPAKGAKTPKKASKKPDVTVVMRPETWLLIAQGQLSPYDALYSGRLRVGGNLDAAKAIVRHLTDPAATYRSPC